MTLRFEPTGPVVEDAPTVRARIAAAWVGIFGPKLDTTAGRPAGQMIDTIAALVADKDAQLLFLSQQLNPNLNGGVWQDAVAKIYFLTRKPALATQVVCECRGLPGTVVAGSARATTGAILNTVAPVTIPAEGVAFVAFAVSVTGPVVIPAGSVTQVLTAVPGWDSIDNVSPGVTGRDVEDRQDFRARRDASVARNSQGRAVSIEGAIADIPTVLDCIVLENDTTAPRLIQGVTVAAHTFAIVVQGGSLEEIARAIYGKKDGGAATQGGTEVSCSIPSIPGVVFTYNIQRPATPPVDFVATVQRTAVTPADVVARVQKAITDQFTGVGAYQPAGIGDPVYAGKYYAGAVLAGADGLETITVNGGAVVLATGYQLPTLGTISVIVKPIP